MKMKDQSWGIGRSTSGVETLDMESEGQGQETVQWI